MFRQRKRKRKFPKITNFVLFISLIIAAALIGNNLPIKILFVECQGDGLLCEEFITYSSKKLGSRKSDFIHYSELLINKLGYRNGYVYKYRFPSKMIFLFEKKSKYYGIYNPDNKKYTIVNSNGVIVAYKDEYNGVTISTNNQLPGKHEQIDGKILKYLVIADVISSYYPNAKCNIKGTEFLSVDIDGYPKVLFPLEGDFMLGIAKLRYILNYLSNDNIAGSLNLNEIDLRYNKPVIR